MCPRIQIFIHHIRKTGLYNVHACSCLVKGAFLSSLFCLVNMTYHLCPRNALQLYFQNLCLCPGRELI